MNAAHACGGAAMTPKIKTYPNGWTVLLDKACGWYCASVRDARGNVRDSIRCDTARMAREYFRIFDRAAKAAGGAS